MPAIESAGDMVNMMTDKCKSRTFGLFLSYGGQFSGVACVMQIQIDTSNITR